MNLSDLKRNAYMLRGSDAKRGYMRWWHSFQGVCPTTQETRTFFVEYSILNPALGTTQPILGQHPYYKRHGMKPSYVCIKAGVSLRTVTVGCNCSPTIHDLSTGSTGSFLYAD